MTASLNNQFTFTDIESSVRDLIANGLSDSADKMCDLILASSTVTLSAEDRSHMLELHGDCTFANNEYRRALQLYRQASHPPVSPSPFTSTPNGSSGSNNSARSSGDGSISTSRQASLRRKECQCHLQLEDVTVALRELEAIPVQHRDVQTNVCLGRLYKNAGLRRHAITTLQLVLAACPLAIECIEMLAELGVKERELTTAAQAQEGAETGVDFLPQLTKSICCNSNSGGLDGNISATEDFARSFPESRYALTQLALRSHDVDKVEEAVTAFSRIRRRDRYSSQGMDVLCKELFARGDFLELSKLATDLLQAQGQGQGQQGAVAAAVGWVAAGCYTQLKEGGGDQAMAFLDKACKVAPRCCFAFTAKGSCFLQRDQPEQACIAFSQANAIRKSVDAYTGLVEVNLRMGKPNDALAAAKCALKLRPTSSACFALLGSVLMQQNPDNANSRNEAKLVLKKALKLNPRNASAAIALADVLCQDNAHDLACVCLKEALDVKPTYELRCRYGKVLGLVGRHDDAIQQLHIAMASPPSPSSNLSEALGELEVIEAAIRGCTQGEEDYDYLNEEGEGEGSAGNNNGNLHPGYDHPDYDSAEYSMASFFSVE